MKAKVCPWSSVGSTKRGSAWIGSSLNLDIQMPIINSSNVIEKVGLGPTLYILFIFVI
jgi:hypothetical protein